jgi:hypothetical protein
MKLLLAVLALVVAALGAAGLALSAATNRGEDGKSCSNRNLQGRYGFDLYARTSPADAAVPTPDGVNTPLVDTGALSSDGRSDAAGRGRWTGVVYTNPPGSANTVDGDTVGLAFTAVYRVRPDCTGHARLTIVGPVGLVPPPLNAAFVLVEIEDGVAQKVLYNTNQLGVYGTGSAELIFSGDED